MELVTPLILKAQLGLGKDSIPLDWKK